MTLRYDGRVAIVTGAGGGLGRQYALDLAARGAKVVVNDLGVGKADNAADAGPAQRVVEEIRAAGGEAIADTHSVADPDDARAIVQSAIDQWGRVDILINNAGILRDKSFAKAEIDALDLVIKVHLNGSLYMTHAAWPHMVDAGYGRIVMTTSIVGLVGNFGQATYAAAKMGVIGLMNTLAIEGARKGVTVNAISPVAATRLTEGLNHPDAVRFLGSELIAPPVLWLCHEDCGDTGMVIEAMAGGYSRVGVCQNEGALYDPAQPVTPEMIARDWADISGMDRIEFVDHDAGGRIERNLRATGHWND